MTDYEKDNHEFLLATFLGIQEGTPLSDYERRRLHDIRLRAPKGCDRRLLAMVLISWGENVGDARYQCSTPGCDCEGKQPGHESME